MFPPGPSVTQGTDAIIVCNLLANNYRHGYRVPVHKDGVWTCVLDTALLTLDVLSLALAMAERGMEPAHVAEALADALVGVAPSTPSPAVNAWAVGVLPAIAAGNGGHLFHPPLSAQPRPMDSYMWSLYLPHLFPHSMQVYVRTTP